MTKLPDKIKQNPDLFIIGATAVLYTGLMIFKQPAFASQLPSWRQNHLQELLTEVNSARDLMPKEYWQFREFYSRGNFTFDDGVIKVGETQIINNLASDRELLMHFESDYLTSDDFLIKKSKTQNLTEQMKAEIASQAVKITDAKIIFENEKTLILESDRLIHIMQTGTADEMRQANGLFDYKGKELEVLEDRFWLSVATIKQ